RAPEWRRRAASRRGAAGMRERSPGHSPGARSAAASVCSGGNRVDRPEWKRLHELTTSETPRPDEAETPTPRGHREAPDPSEGHPVNSTTRGAMHRDDWWRTAVIYQVYPRS